MDNVHVPYHYCHDGIECKYLWRWSRKNGIEDLRKAKQCIDFMIEEIGDE